MTADSPRGAAGQLGQARVVEAHGDLGREVLELVAGQPELGEDHEVGAALPGLGQQGPVTLEVRVERPELRRDLGERNSQRSHALEHTRRPRRGLAIGSRGC